MVAERVWRAGNRDKYRERFAHSKTRTHNPNMRVRKNNSRQPLLQAYPSVPRRPSRPTYLQSDRISWTPAVEFFSAPSPGQRKRRLPCATSRRADKGLAVPCPRDHRSGRQTRSPGRLRTRAVQIRDRVPATAQLRGCPCRQVIRVDRTWCIPTASPKLFLLMSIRRPLMSAGHWMVGRNLNRAVPSGRLLARGRSPPLHHF